MTERERYMTEVIIKAGEKWTRNGVTIEWLKDFRRGDVMDLDAMLVDGEKPAPDDATPAGFFRVGWNMAEGVEVTRDD